MSSLPERGPSRLSLLRGDARALHADAANAGALFQVASQFNLLEMVHPGVTPEQGVTGYESDATQGPACAIAAGAGTIYRNYFIPIGDPPGQTEGRQVDCLAGVGAALGNDRDRLWKFRNGYALASSEGLGWIRDHLAQADASEIDGLRERLEVGIHWNTEVTISQTRHSVAQVYGSALPVAYSGIPSTRWEPFARFVLQASYEATLLAARLSAESTGNRLVYLTLLGGGAFGNELAWILDGIRHALERTSGAGLDLRLVTFGAPHPDVSRFVEACA